MLILINSQLFNPPYLSVIKESLEQADNENDKEDQFRDMVLIVRCSGINSKYIYIITIMSEENKLLALSLEVKNFK